MRFFLTSQGIQEVEEGRKQREGDEKELRCVVCMHYFATKNTVLIYRKHEEIKLNLKANSCFKDCVQ